MAKLTTFVHVHVVYCVQTISVIFKKLDFKRKSLIIKKILIPTYLPYFILFIFLHETRNTFFLLLNRDCNLWKQFQIANLLEKKYFHLQCMVVHELATWQASK